MTFIPVRWTPLAEIQASSKHRTTSSMTFIPVRRTPLAEIQASSKH